MVSVRRKDARMTMALLMALSQQSYKNNKVNTTNEKTNEKNRQMNNVNLLLRVFHVLLQNFILIV